MNKEEAIKIVRSHYPANKQMLNEALEFLIPELKEDENEKIRKEIISVFKGQIAFTSEEDGKKYIDWLEKQVTPQVRTGIEWVNTIDDACDKRYLEEYAEGEYCHEQSFKWGFQEGVDWLEKQDKSVEINPDEIIEECHQDNADHIIDIVTEQRKPSEWNEEDELHIRELESLVKQEWAKAERENDRDKIHKMSDLSFFLKTLKPQLKQEWSEEDENECNHILKLLNLVAEEQEAKGYNNLISSVNWLKSLKDRIQSKPRKKNIEQNLAKKYGITGIGSKHAEGKLGEMIKKKIETENVDNTNKVEPKFKVGDIVQYITDSTDRRKIEEVDTFCNMYHTDSSPIMFEIEDEWKVVVNAEDVEYNPTDKIEPKFKINDYVVRKNGKKFDNDRKFAKIIKINKTIFQPMYLVNCENWLYEDEIRLWSILDAQDGDILATADNKPFIYNGWYNESNIGAHCGLNIINAFTIGNKQCNWCSNYNIRPATKKERQSLFDKMNLLGWIWNPETKELNRLDKDGENNN